MYPRCPEKYVRLLADANCFKISVMVDQKYFEVLKTAFRAYLSTASVMVIEGTPDSHQDQA